MSDPLANVQRLVDEWERDAEQKAARYDSMRQEVEQISITESAAGGAVSVTVGHNGIPNDVTMTDGVSRMRPEEIAAAVLEAMKRAQGRYPAELARIMADTVGDDTASRYILAEAERNFPPASDSDPPEDRPRRRGDDGDFSGETFLR